MEEKILFKRKIGFKGNSLSVSIPPELMEYLEAKEGDEVCLYGDRGKYGKFLAIWVKDDLEEKENVD